MVRSELLQRLCNLYPDILRKDLEKILEIIARRERNFLLTNKCYQKQNSVKMSNYLMNLVANPEENRIPDGILNR